MAAWICTRLGGAVLCLLLGSGLLAACGGEGEAGYGDEFRDGFLRTCDAATGGNATICECTYERLQATVPFDEAAELDRQLQDDPEHTLEPELADLIAGCVAGAVPPSVVTTTSSTTPVAPDQTDPADPAESDGAATTAAEAG